MKATPGREDEVQLEESLRQLLDEAPDGIFVLRDRNSFLFVNYQATHMLGYELSEILEMTPASIFSDDIISVCDPQALDFPESALKEIVLQKKDGQVFHAEVNCRKRQDSTVIAVVRDISHRKQNEERQRISERNLRQALTSTANIFYVIDRYGRITLINEGVENILEKIWGKPVKVGTNILELIPPDREAVVLKSLERVFSGESVEYELEVNVPGVPAWILATYIPVRNEAGLITGAAIVTKDITERKHAEEELRRSESRFEMISRTTNDAVWDWDLETGRLWSNDTHQTLYGLTKKDPVPSEAEWAARIHPEDRAAVVGMQQRILNSDKNVFISEYRFYTEVAGYRHIYDRCYIVRGEDGRAIRMMGSMMDVTDQKEIEQELRKSEEKYRTLIEQASDFILIMDKTGKFLDANTNFCKIFGYEREELKSMNILDLYAPGELDRQPPRFGELTSGKSILSNRRVVARDGVIYDIEANVSMLEDGRIMAIARDVGERKKAEQAIRTIEETRKLIMNSALDAIVCADQSGNVIVWTPQAEKVFGWKEEEVLGKNLAETIIPPQYRQMHMEGMNRYLTTGEKRVMNRLMEMTALNKAGTEFPVEISITPVQQGNTLFFCAFIRDITERKKSEAKVAESNARFQIVSRATSDIVWDWDIAGNTFWWNDNYYHSQGYEKLSERVDIHDWLDHIHPDDYQRVHDKIMATVGGTENTWRDEYRYRRADGVYLDFLDRGFIIRDTDGRATRMIGSMIDMTPISEAQRQVKESENRLRTILDTDPECIKLLGPDCELIDINRAGLAMLDAENAESLLGKSLLPMVGQSYRQHIAHIVRDAYLGQSGMAEFEMVTFKGTLRWCEIRVVPFRDADGTIIYVLALTIDNTAKRAAELELKQSEEKYRTLVEGAADTIALFEAHGHIIDVNESACQLLGYTREELKTLTIFDVLSKKDLELAPIQFDVLERGEATIRQRKMVRKDGTLVETEVHTKKLSDGNYIALVRDLTERIKAEEAIRELEKQFTLFMNTTPVMAWIVDENGTFRYMNPFYADVFTGGKDLTGHPFHEVFSPEVAAHFNDNNNRVFQSDEILRTIEPIKVKGDQEMILQVYKFPLGKSNGRKMLGCIAIDITEITQARERILRERDLSDSIINSLPGIFYLFNSEGQYLRWNDQLEITSGYSSEEIAKMHPTDFVKGPELEYIKERISEVFEMGVSDAEADLVTKDGRRIPHYFTGVKVMYNNMPCLIGTGIDITDRKKAESRLVRSEERYRTLVEQAIDAIALYDENGQILDVNSGAEILLGYNRQELANMTLDQILTPEEKALNPVRYDILKKGDSTVKYRKMIRKDGSVVETEVRSQRLPDGRYLSVIRDMSERIRTKQELENSYRAIRKLTAHLQNIREEERAHIAREIHDELGQQLTVLKMDVSWINKRINDSADDMTKDKMRELLSMLDDTVKTVRRISSELRPSLLDDLGLMAAMEWQLKEFEKRSGIKTQIESPDSDIKLSNHVKTALFRIFQESLTNVARHSKAKHVVVSLDVRPEMFTLSIEDDGQGFDKSQLAEKKTLGILGMTERTTMIGGTYEIVSSPVSGTRVSVSVPVNAKNLNFD